MTDVGHPVVLAYAPPNVPAERRNVRGWLFLLPLFPGLVVPFVNFTFGTSPLEALRIWSFPSELIFALLAAGFFIIFPLVGWKARLLLHPSAPQTFEKIAAWVIALLCLAIPSGMLGYLCWDSTPKFEWDNPLALVMLGSGFAVLGLGVWQTIRWRRSTGIAIDTLLAAAYLSNAVVCLVGFHEDPELGYWLTVPAAGVLLLELVSRSLRRQNGL